MKKISNKIIMMFIIVMGLSSCDSFLDKTPDNRLRLDSYDKIAELVTNAYPDGSGQFMEWMSDNVGTDPKNVQRRDMTQSYKWQDVDLEGQDTPSYYWTSNYMAIAHANQALLALEEVKENNPELKKAIRGEALACRAFAHFMLVNVFAKSYNPQTASSDNGIVIMEQPEVSLLVQYKRSTVKQVYDFVEKDLLEALDLVSDKYYKNTGKYHFNKNALFAFASRFYLLKRDYAACEKYSTMVLGTEYSPAMVRNYKDIYTGTSSEIIATKFTDSNLKSNLLLIRKDVLYAYKGYTGYRFNQDVYNSLVISKKDLRFSISYSFGGTASFLPKFQRELIKKTSLTSSSGYPYTIEIGFRSEEVFFNRLESWLNMGADKLPLFESHFNQYLMYIYSETINYTTLLANYKKAYPGMSNDKLRLIMVLDEKRREFVEEGLRWFDICRHNIPVRHTDINGNTDILKENDARKIVQIPQTAIKYGELEPNIRELGSEPQAHVVNRN